MCGIQKPQGQSFNNEIMTARCPEKFLDYHTVNTISQDVGIKIELHIHWHFCSKKNALTIEKINRKALRIVVNDYTLSYADLLSTTKQCPLYVSHLKSMATEMFKSLTHNSLTFIENLFTMPDTPYGFRGGKSIIQPSVETTTAPSQYPKRRLFVRSRKVSKPRDWYYKSSYRFAAEVPVKFQSDRKILNTNLAASRLYEILRKDVFSDIETGPTFGLKSFRYEGDKVWNNIPSQMKCASSLNNFKVLVKQWTDPSCRCGSCVLCDIDQLWAAVRTAC